MAQYVVKSGDTLSGIGSKYGVPYQQITGYRSGNPNLIYPGEVLTIPDKKGAVAPAPSSAPIQSSTPAPVSAPTVNPAQQIIDIATQNQAKANQAFKDYNKSNPFNYDQVLAENTTKAKEQLDPYYNETLSNYLLGVTRKVANSASDTRDLLGELTASTDSFGRDTQLKLTDTLNKAGQGYADAGLFDSGARLNTEGLAKTESQNATTDFTRQQDYKAKQATTADQRVQQDYGLGNFSADNQSAPVPGLLASQDIRNNARQEATDTSTLASKLTGESGQQYVSGFQATLPAELQSNNNFDLLKQIGVYS